MKLVRAVSSETKVKGRAVPVALVMSSDEHAIPDRRPEASVVIDISLEGYEAGLVRVTTRERVAKDNDDRGLVYRGNAIVGDVVDVDGAVVSVCWRRSRDGRAEAQGFADAAATLREGLARGAGR